MHASLAAVWWDLFGCTPVAPLQKYWDVQFFKARTNSWCKGWLYITPSQVLVKESWAIFFTSTVFGARLSANTSVHVRPSDLDQCCHLTHTAHAIKERMAARTGSSSSSSSSGSGTGGSDGDVLVLDDRRQDPIVLRCSERSVFLAKYFQSVQQLGLMSFEAKREEFEVSSFGVGMCVCVCVLGRGMTRGGAFACSCVCVSVPLCLCPPAHISPCRHPHAGPVPGEKWR